MEPHFLTLKTTGHTDDWATAAAGMRGQVLASADQSDVTPLEPGTAHSGLIIVRFPVAADLDAFWASPACRSLEDCDSGLTALACAGLPWEGWPGHFVPTIATVNVPAAEASRTFMVIEGTGTDQDRMDRYRDMILPMMRERGAYYVAFELGGNVRVLAGEWSEGIFAISRWPSRAHAEDFWFGEKYQNEAVPIRTGVGRFDVQIVDGIAG
jgi:uncharacterized protein (DUF1330 family)